MKTRTWVWAGWMLLSLVCFSTESAFQWTGMKHAFKDGAVELLDDRTDAGLYLITTTNIPFDRNKDCFCQVQVHVEDGAINRPGVFVRVFDADGKALSAFRAQFTGNPDKDGFRTYAKTIEASEWPANAAYIKLMLQPASGNASETGKATFRNIEFKVKEQPAVQYVPMEKQRWTGMEYIIRDGVMELEDNRTDAGMYLITADSTPIDSSKAYLFNAQIRKEAGAANRPVAYLRVFDASGKLLRSFTTTSVGSADSDGFLACSSKILPADWPVGAAAVKFMLQPAAGKAEELGKAQFRNLQFSVIEEAAMLDGINRTKDFFFKLNNIQVADKELKCSPFARRGAKNARLEIAAPAICGYQTLQLVGTSLPASAIGYLWNEKRQQFEAQGHLLKATKVAGGMAYALEAFPDCCRVAVEFPDAPSLFLEQIRVYCKPYPEENWNANWIWFTPERIDNIDLWMRREYEFKETPEQVILQCAVDDVADLYVNGHLVAKFGGRESPPNFDIRKFLLKGKNVIAVKVRQYRYSAGFLGELDCRYADGHEEKYVTDKTWRWSRQEPAENWTQPSFDASTWGFCIELAKPPQGEWGKVRYRLNTRAVSMTIQNPEEIPARLTAGETLRATLKIQAENAIAATPLVITLRQGSTQFQQWDAGMLPAGQTEIALPIELDFHQFLVPGDFVLECSAAYCQFFANQKPFRAIMHIDNPRRADLGTAKIQPVFGVPTIFVEGKPVASSFTAVSMCTLPFRMKHHRIFQAAQWNFVHLYIKPGWQGDVPDFRMLDAAAANMLAGNPNAKAVLKVVLRDSQSSFAKQHPEERVVFDDGSIRGNCSLASILWREHMKKYVIGLIDHVAASPYADKIVGCCVGEGEEGQWLHYWGAADPAVKGAFSDYSAPMLRRFRQYLREKYSTVENLRKAWNQPEVTFDTAAIPDQESRAANDYGFLRDPVKRAPVIDYAEALSIVVVEGMEYYGKLIKEKTNGRWLTGAMYGHVMDVGMYMLLEQCGALAQRQALDLPHVDFFMGPLQYHQMFRDLGGVGSFDTPSPGSCLLHNKIWINEDDLRTHLTFPVGYAYSVRSTAQMDHVLARQVGKSICGRAGHYLLPLGREDNHNWYDDPESIITLKELNTIAQGAASKDRSSRSQIAVFADADGVKYTRQLRHMWPEDSVMRYAIFQREPIGRIGAAFDEYMQSELENPALPSYRFYIFINPFHLTSRQVDKITELSKDQSIRILFLYAPGIASEKGLGLELANQLTGMDFTLDMTVRPSLIETRFAVGDLKVGSQFGWPKERFSPAPVPRSFDRLLAVFPDDATPAAVTKGNIAYSTIGALPVEILRQLALEAGVNLRSTDNLAVYECASYLAVHSSVKPGPCQVMAPDGFRLQQLWPVQQEALPLTVQKWNNTGPVTKIFQIVK